MHGSVHVPGEMSTMNLRPFSAESRMRWRRLDVPGRDEARVVRTPAGWRRESWQSSVGSLQSGSLKPGGLPMQTKRLEKFSIPISMRYFLRWVSDD
jgi:hypothetical protein